MEGGSTQLCRAGASLRAHTQLLFLGPFVTAALAAAHACASAAHACVSAAHACVSGLDESTNQVAFPGGPPPILFTQTQTAAMHTDMAPGAWHLSSYRPWR